MMCLPTGTPGAGFLVRKWAKCRGMTSQCNRGTPSSYFELLQPKSLLNNIIRIAALGSAATQAQTQPNSSEPIALAVTHVDDTLPPPCSRHYTHTGLFRFHKSKESDFSKLFFFFWFMTKSNLAFLVLNAVCTLL